MALRMAKMQILFLFAASAVVSRWGCSRGNGTEIIYRITER